MSKSKCCILLTVFLAASLLGLLAPTQVKGQLPAGIPRGDIVVLSMDVPGRIAEPEWGNVWVPGKTDRTVGYGYSYEPLMVLNHSSGKYIPVLAESLPVYEDNYTKMRIKLKSGIYWSDGVELTAEDIVYTIMLQKNTTGMSGYALYNKYVEKAYAEDRYTVVIELKQRAPKFHMSLASLIPMPKHIFEKVEDPLTFPFFPPVTTGAYIGIDYDPQGYWFLYERREDWYRTGIGKTFGKPKPKYILRIYYGADEKDVMAISKHELDFTEVGFAAIDPALKASPYARGWWKKGFPHAFQDPAETGVGFNTAKYPYNITDIRWALTLIINVTEIEITAFDCEARLAACFGLLNPYVGRYYKDLVLPWLKNFTYDGIKVFDDTIPNRIADYVENVLGYELAADPATVYGPGSYKYAPEEAERLLEKHGFYRGADGKWRLPDGTPWTINLVARAAPPPRAATATAVAEQWRKFGIDVQLELIETGLFFKRFYVGDFDACEWSGMICPHPDISSSNYNRLHPSYYKPLGERASGLWLRWVNEEVGRLVDEAYSLPPEDPRVYELMAEAVKIYYANAVEAPLFCTSRPYIFDEYAWTNWPSGENYYWTPAYWAPTQFLPILCKIEPTGRAPTSEMAVEYVGVYITGPVPEFIGVDGEKYGPFSEGDYARLPREDAERLIDEGLASYKPPTAPEISELVDKVSTIEAGVASLEETMSELETTISNLSGQLSSLTTTLMGLQAATIILIIITIAIVMVKTKK